MGDCKPLIPILGVPLVERVIRSALEAEVDDFYVTTGYNGEYVRAFLDHLAQRLKIHITPIVNEDWEKENGLSVLKAKGYLCGPFLLLMADHIIDESILVRLKNERITDGEVILAVDYHSESRKFANIDDATKVVIKDNRIIEIGKNVKDSNAFDTGIFLCSLAIFSALERSLENGDSSLSGGIKILAQQGKVRVFDIGQSRWVDVDDEKQLRRAEKLLCGKLIKPSDGLVSRYLNRPISLKITRHFFLKTGINPNFISIFSFLLSLLAAFFFFLGGYINLAIGAILTQVSSVVDGCDGEVARLKYKSTDFGGWFDAVLDRYADGFILFALTYHTYFANDNSLLVFTVGFLALIGTFMNSYTADKYDGLMRKKLGSGKYYFRIGRDSRMFIIFLGALANEPLLTLVLIALITNIENIRRVAVLYKNG